MTWVAVAIGGSALVGAGASYLGSKKQAQGAQQAAGINLDMFNTLNRQQQPYIQGGYGAMGRLNTLLGINPNPSYQAPSMPSTPAWRPTPGGGVEPMMQVGPPRTSSPNARLNDLLAIRAAHGDRQAQAVLQGIQP